MKWDRPGPATTEYDARLFDRSGRWDLSLDPKQEQRVASSLEMIPESARTILDVGCGSGAITRRMLPGRYVVGCDPSIRGLWALEGLRVCGSLERLPFNDGSFDAVTAFEVLEHLPAALVFSACAELARVAREYVLISVPNSEDLVARQTKCPVCSTRFHVYNHLTSFRRADMNALVPGFAVERLHATGHSRPGAERLPRWLRSVGVPAYTWVSNATCPNCRTSGFPPGRIHTWGLKLIGLFASLTPWWRVEGGWIIARYRKSG